MAKKDASKYLGGMSGKAAGALRGRGAALDAAINSATGSAPAKKKTPPAKSKKK